MLQTSESICGCQQVWYWSSIASRLLTSCLQFSVIDRNTTLQIEKELLAVIYGLEHFNYYTYGRLVLVQTDHKPLLGLSKKPYDTISPRLQRTLLRLNQYEITLAHVPGKQLLIADALSRAQLTDALNEEEEGANQRTPVTLWPLASTTSSKWEEYSKLTASDQELHVSHRGVVACKSKAREYFYWPGINRDVHCRCRDEIGKKAKRLKSYASKKFVP
ncbi:hypothetical protein AVEN_192118-1 [Araneus ventricosus]|uniref:RNA-directed DNA polymerase n=1 Tax=Araneus ventricosus TaxID=182803 RepID=A0A4Y2B855_ARAVE|nr:hypothetical protein AVEN_192118-1 [Araneus ventricosus]